MSNRINFFVVLLLILNGLLFVSNIYVIGDREAAIEMHEDLAPFASSLIVQAKVIICFITGILYLMAAYGMIQKKYNLLLSGVIGSVIFIGLYLIELLLWGKTHLGVWVGFSIFGGFGIFIGLYSYNLWKRKKPT